jgi:hypothetical protein
MCNTCSRFNSVNTLSQPIGIALEDDNTLIVSHNGQVNNSLEYKVNSLYTSIFFLANFSINPLDTAGYKYTCGRVMCCISSTSITVTGNQDNDLYIISPTTILMVLVSSMSTKSTPGNETTKRIQQSSSTHSSVPSIVHSTELASSSLHTATPISANTARYSPSATNFPMTTGKPIIMP